MPEIDPVILQLRADVAKYRVDVEQTSRRVNEQLDSQGKAVVRLENQIKASTAQIGSSMRALATSLAAGFSAREVANMADSYTRFTNQLKVAGLEGDSLAGTQERLFQVAQKNGVELEAVGSLYSRAAQNQKELGAGAEDLISLTRAVTASLRISGTSTNEASGALLQLGQAFGSPRIQAEEFNSLIDTMQPLLREAAKYIDGTGNSLSGLTRKIKDTNGPGVSNVELFRAIIRAMADLEKTAGSTTLTISGAFTNLSNAITKYVGEADSANGATALVTSAINALADNLDTVTEALSVIAVAMGVRYVASAGSATIATIAASDAMFALQARAAGAATSTEALAFALRGLGGGLITAAIAALGVAMYVTAGKINDTREATGAYAKAQNESAAVSEKAANAAQKLANAHGKAREEALALARAEAENIRQKLASARASIVLAKAELTRAQAKSQAILGGAKDESLLQQIGRGFSGAAGASVGNAVVAEGGVRAAEANVAAAKKTADSLAKSLDSVTAAINGVAAPKVAPVSAGTGKKGGKDRASGSSGPSADDMAKRQSEELSRLNQEELRARADLTTNVQDRAELERQLLAAQRDERIKAIEDEKGLNAQQKAARLEYIKRLYGDPDSKTGADGEIVVTADRSLLGRRLARDVREQEARLANDALARQAEALDAQASIATGLAERRDLERRALEIQQQIERNLLEQDIATGQVADAAAARAALEAKQSATRAGLERSNESPLARYSRRLNETNVADQVEGYVVDELQHVQDGIASALQKAIGTDDPLITGLLNLFIQEVLLKPIAAALAQNAGGGGGGGIISAIGSAIGSVFGGARASGGPVSNGNGEALSDP